MDVTTLAPALLAAAVGIGIGYALHLALGKKNSTRIDSKIQEKLLSAKEKIQSLKEESEKELDQRKQQIIELEKRISERETKLDLKLDDIEKKEQEIQNLKSELESEKQQYETLREEEQKRLVEISGLTSQQAEQNVLKIAEDRTKEEIVRRVRKMEQEGEHQLEEKAHDILSLVIQRYASSHVAENSTSHVDVPDASMIGRIIGKEGRNIQHLERVTGCEIVIEEGNTIMVSGFSPVRRQVAKRTIEALMKDGRVHPGRIEEVVEEAKKKINDDIRESGEAALFDLGILDFPPQLVHLVGRMKYRTSYRQNILKHSWEAARIAIMLAEELGADVEIAKKATLLHDIGKAIDHEVEGNHVEIGEKIMRKFNISEAIIKAAAAHHEDYPFDTREAIIVQVADAISAARPGARKENVEEYVKRMENLEQIATSYEGVNKAYAIYAGREVRVFVEPKKIDDLAAIKLAQDIAKQIEQELTYPGDVKVNVIREIRADALAR